VPVSDVADSVVDLVVIVALARVRDVVEARVTGCVIDVKVLVAEVVDFVADTELMLTLVLVAVVEDTVSEVLDFVDELDESGALVEVFVELVDDPVSVDCTTMAVGTIVARVLVSDTVALLTVVE
jgi:hypothetical protein